MCPWCSSEIGSESACASCGALLSQAVIEAQIPGVTVPDLTDALASHVRTQRARRVGAVLAVIGGIYRVFGNWPWR